MEEEIEWKGQRYLLEWFDDKDFENLDNVIQVYGLVFDDKGKICVVNVRHSEDGWCLPGGGVENFDKDFEATLIREADEEADLDIKDIERVGCFKVTPLRNSCERGEHYLVRYVAKVDKVREQALDPAHGKIPLRKFINVEDFTKIVNWGKSGEVQLKMALEVLDAR